MSEQAVLSLAQRQQGQRAALLSNIWIPSLQLIMMGPIMMLFASDVLQLKASSIAAIIGFAPLLVILRFPLLPLIRRFGLRRTLVCTDASYLFIIAALMFLPLEYLSFGVLLLCLMMYKVAQVLGPTTVWQPLMRDITTNKDRGRFFARMRFCFTVVTLLVSAAMTFMIGDSISRGEYNVLLGISFFGVLNRMFWSSRIPERDYADSEQKRRKSLWSIAKESRLLRRPLLVVALLTLSNVPVFVVYLRQCLGVPANMVSAFMFMGTLGSVLSMILWGRIADAIGFKPMLIGLIIMTCCLAPSLLLVAPIEDAQASWATISDADLLSYGVLLLNGLIGGAMAAGTGIASTSIQHAHTRSHYSLEEMAVFSVLVLACQSISTFIAGYVIESWVKPSGSQALMGGTFQWDWMKVYIIVIGNGLSLLALVMLIKLQNIRPHFGLSDFFTSMVAQPIRTMFRGRYMYHEDERMRVSTARLLGHNTNPLAVDPLLELVDDPSYDVRCEAINALARTASPTAAERLMELLQDNERRQLWDRVAWALGELEWEPAGPILQQYLEDADLAYRIRAMCARALGKIGDQSAKVSLARLLEDERQSFHFRSSCCCALLHLRAVEYGSLIFNEINSMRDRHDRYEILALTCECLDLEPRWLVSGKASMTTYDMLWHAVQLRSATWQAQRDDVIQAFLQKDFQTIAGRFRQAIQQLEQPGPEHVMLEALAAFECAEQRWGPNSNLATAWLLYNAQ